jgi:hypothetical protein
MNKVLGINIKVHSNGDGSLSFWRSPEPIGTRKPSLLSQVAKAETKFREAAQMGVGLVEAEKELEIVRQKTLKVGKSFIRKKRGKSISQPIAAILNYYKITKREWDLKHPDEQIKLWIQAEVAIKREQERMEFN